MPCTEPDRHPAAADPDRFRHALLPGDRPAIAGLVAATGRFTPAEIDVAVELVDQRNAHGAASGYHFLLADGDDGRLVGYTCYGPIACTQASFDLYWIAVAPTHQGRGLGRQLLRRTEQAIAQLQGRQVYIETSTRADYAPTRAFYRRCGYRCEAILKDFYAPADHRATFSRCLS